MKAFKFWPLRIQMYRQTGDGVAVEWSPISFRQFLRYWWRKEKGGFVFVEVDAKGMAIVR